MLSQSFDAAFFGLAIPRRATPLKKLPIRKPPSFKRPSRCPRVALQSIDGRNLMEDTWLWDDDLDECLGRILEVKLVAAGAVEKRIKTTCGMYLVRSDMTALRGKLANRMSIHSHKLKIKTAM